MTDPNEYTLTTGEVAKRLGHSDDTIARWADLGLLPYWRSGLARAPRKFRPDDVDAFAAKRAVASSEAS